MNDQHGGSPPVDTHQATGTFDREISLRVVVWTGLGLAALTAVACLLMWLLLQAFDRLEKRQDPAPSPVREANRPVVPPEPRLQIDPTVDMEALRAEEEKLLRKPAWVDRGRGALRLPIDEAIEVIARRGVGAEVVGGQPGTAPGTAEGGAGIPAPPPQQQPGERP